MTDADDRVLRALQYLNKQSEVEQSRVEHDWSIYARPTQLPPPGNWRIWLLLAGRGFGKTRSGAEWVRDQVGNKGARRIALIAPTAQDARAVMVEGESGLLAIAAPEERLRYEPSNHRLTWRGGAIATLFSADEPERLRGPQFDAAWCDELAAWRYEEAWHMLMFGLRLGAWPRVVVTTTPKPIRLIRKLLQMPGCVVTRGRTQENAAHLAPSFLEAVERQYAGTRLGRQELEAELLDDPPSALWQRAAIETARVSVAPSLRRAVVAIDPAGSTREEADETGIIVAALGHDAQFYVLADLSGRYRPHEWALRAIAAFHAHQADRIVAEANLGGDMIEATLRTVEPAIAYKSVHASRGKALRAEPIAALYEQGRVHHVGAFAALEDQMCAFTADFDRVAAGYSPDRLDALVWALTELSGTDGTPGLLDYYRLLAG